MKITDGKKTISIELRIWVPGSGYGPDWSADCFNASTLEYDEEAEAYHVDSVDDCIEYAEDWKYSRGDFQDDIPNENNDVLVEVLE